MLPVAVPTAPAATAEENAIDEAQHELDQERVQRLGEAKFVRCLVPMQYLVEAHTDCYLQVFFDGVRRATEIHEPAVPTAIVPAVDTSDDLPSTAADSPSI